MSQGSNGAAHSEVRASRKIQELWFTLARLRWRSLVLVPADASGSTADLARSFADVGGKLSDYPVTAITVGTLEYGTARALADLHQHLESMRDLPVRREPTVDVSATPVEGVPRDDDDIPRATGGEALSLTTAAQIVIAIPPVVSEPLGLGIAHVADAVVLTVQIGHTALADVRRTVDMVGRDRIAGCLLV